MRDVKCKCLGFLSPMHKKITDSYSKREGGNPGNSGLSSQQYTTPGLCGRTAMLNMKYLVKHRIADINERKGYYVRIHIQTWQMKKHKN